jgi:hypothetical protein
MNRIVFRIYVLENEVKVNKEPHLEVMRHRIYLGSGFKRGLDPQAQPHRRLNCITMVAGRKTVNTI